MSDEEKQGVIHLTMKINRRMRLNWMLVRL